MSLEEKFANLSIDDVSSIVDSVKADGVAKSGLPESIVALTARCASKDEAEALSGLKVVKELAESVPTAQPFIKDTLGACLQQAISKSKDVQAAAKETAFAICDNICPFAMKALLPIIFSCLPVEKKWQIRELALNCLARFKAVAPRQLADSLPLVVPEVTACMWDTKKQVKKASTDAMKQALEVIGNRDIEHMTGKILTAITKPKDLGISKRMDISGDEYQGLKHCGAAPNCFVSTDSAEDDPDHSIPSWKWPEDFGDDSEKAFA